PSDRPKFVLWRWFNAGYGYCERLYSACIRWIVRHPLMIMALYVVLIAVAAWGFLALPTGFLPVEDQGYFIISPQLPDAASQAWTREVDDKLTQILRATPGVANVNAIGGQNLFEGTVNSNAAACYVTYKDWKERRDPSQSQDAILAHLREEFA